PEEVEDTGIVYWSRFYRLRPGAERPHQEGPVAGDLGYLKFAVFAGDNGTFSITLATATDDAPLRRLTRPDAFQAVAASLVPIAPWVEPGLADPLGSVHLMARLLNRKRHFVVDGVPLAPGLHAVGDASVCTNPLYGRGCSLAMVQACLLADAVSSVPGDPVAQAVAFDASTMEEIDPWYTAAVAQDRRSRRVAAGRASEGEAFVASLVAEGVMPAVRTDPVVFRAFLRVLNLLDRPDRILSDPDLVARVNAVWERRAERPPAPPLGPARDELLARLAVLEPVA
ncbi:MAG: FAD-dependent oxidoreductase, partial [Actinomycetota bacterium]|nr:FAD-dependent oxidoreductase [Actinomycetota bacterium]